MISTGETDVHWTHRAKARMKKLGITQEDLLAPLGVTRGAIGHYLNRRRPLSVEQAMALAEALDCSMDYLFFGRQQDTFFREPPASYHAMSPGADKLLNDYRAMDAASRRSVEDFAHYLADRCQENDRVDFSESLDRLEPEADNASTG